MDLLDAIPCLESVADDDWDAFLERFEQYCIAYQMPDSKKSLLLLAALDKREYKLLRENCAPVAPINASYEVLQQQIRLQMFQTSDVFSKRYDFYAAVQNKDKTILEWFTEVRRRSRNCKFGSQMESIVRDRFISGMMQSPVLERLYEVLIEDMDLRQVVQIALNIEDELNKAKNS